MRKFLVAGAIVATALSWSPACVRADDQATHPVGPILENLLHEVLEGVEGTEVIVSRVRVPPNTSLPRHWHPGEEFAYVLEGSATLWQEGKDDIVVNAGEVAKVPLRQVHTAISGEEGATFLVFRVHVQGEPERVLVEEQ